MFDGEEYEIKIKLYGNVKNFFLEYYCILYIMMEWLKEFLKLDFFKMVFFKSIEEKGIILDFKNVVDYFRNV